MIFFDIDDTLLNHRGAERMASLKFYNEYAQVFSCETESFVIEWNRAAEKYMNIYLNGDMTFKEQRRARIGDVFPEGYFQSDDDIDEMFGEYLNFYESCWALFPDVVESLDALSDYPMGVISNGDSIQQRRKLKALNISKYFSTIVVSSDLGISKPDPAIFSHASEIAGYQPGECFYVGDRIDTDALASVKAGMKGVWVNRGGVEGNSDADIFTIVSLEQLKSTVVGRL